MLLWISSHKMSLRNCQWLFEIANTDVEEFDSRALRELVLSRFCRRVFFGESYHNPSTRIRGVVQFEWAVTAGFVASFLPACSLLPCYTLEQAVDWIDQVDHLCIVAGRS